MTQPERPTLEARAVTTLRDALLSKRTGELRVRIREENKVQAARS